MADDEKGSKPGCVDGDQIAIVGPTLGGLCPIIRHHQNHTIEAGVARIITPEEAVNAPGALYLEHHEGNRFNVQTLSRGGSDARVGKAHSRAATPEYRDNWDSIFGKKAPLGQA